MHVSVLKLMTEGFLLWSLTRNFKRNSLSMFLGTQVVLHTLKPGQHLIVLLIFVAALFATAVNSKCANFMCKLL
jgi:hypothetical protein